MREDFYVDENELVIAANEVFGMTNYYVATLEKYVSIMTAVKSESIIGSEINSEIEDIISMANAYKQELQNLGDKFRNTVVDEVKSVEENSTYSFPTDPDLESIFAM